ncbi:DUF3857 domain-containing protein [Winogradskyella eckloniae]|uniref:DUF3857 domain-containing protein n=1 Tax=Winogradskyella eckloniae TaxID=1089306 RepID=UPI001564000F|nr:DUF3857 domain-containing protein [Winogradskyella eckloniae]NRD21164.1 DUF3857 domain-containing protein [Winogradskyella eckloniae]
MKHRLFIVVFFTTLFSFSQTYNTDMSVTKNELENTSYAKDSTANALVIYDYGNSFVNDKTFWLNVQIKQKIKVLRPEGIDRGEYEIKLYKNKNTKEKIEDIKGITYNLENGKIVKSYLEEKAIFREENENYTLVKFVLPNVQVGSIITVSYETHSRFMAKFQPWYFQGNDPVLYSEYNTSIPGNYDYHVKLVGNIPLDVNEAKIRRECLTVGNGGHSDCTDSRYVMTNIPAYIEEDYTTTSLNYISRIEYELSVFHGFDGRIDKITKTWKDADHELKVDSDFGKQLSKSSLVKNVLPATITSISDPLKKAKAIYQFVLDTYTWNGKSERYDVSVKNLIKEKVGSVFEINLLLENLLTSENIKTNAVLLSTRGNAFATKLFPVLTDFNYVILKVSIGDKNYFLDATNKYHIFGELPFRALNQYGRLIDFENGSKWQDIAVKDYSTRSHIVELSSFTDDEFIGKITSKSTGYHSHYSKQQYVENSTAYYEQKINDYDHINIENHKVVDFDNSKSEIKENLEITVEPEFIGNKIYLNPFLLTFFDENPFKLQERSYPIDFGYKDIYMYSMKINLDENIKILEAPKAVNYSLPNKAGSLIFNSELTEDTLILYFKVNFNSAIYTPEYYPYLKVFMDKVVELQNNSVIVLEKQ